MPVLFQTWRSLVDPDNHVVGIDGRTKGGVQEASRVPDHCTACEIEPPEPGGRQPVRGQVTFQDLGIVLSEQDRV